MPGSRSRRLAHIPALRLTGVGGTKRRHVQHVHKIPLVDQDLLLDSLMLLDARSIIIQRYPPLVIMVQN
jgi:hypothetical protein